MKGKILVLLVGMALLVGVLSGCVEEEEQPPENVEPTADFSATVDNTTVTFEDTSSDTDGNITAWSWDFGDGTTNATQNPVHTYAEDNKTYTVTLTVTDDDGATATTTDTVTVGTPPVGPTADFVYSPMINITFDTNITFTDNSTAGTLAITNWTWDFGDGNYSYEQNATYNYAVNDTYTVTLTVTDANELSDEISVTIEVEAAEEA